MAPAPSTIEPHFSRKGIARPVSVMHLLHTMAYGGVETAVINWLLRIDRERFTPHLVVFSNPDHSESHFVTAAEAAGLTVHKIPWGRRKPLWKAARALSALMREKNVQVLHTHNWYADFVGALAARFVPVKTITTVYVWSDFDWKRNLLQWIDRYVIRSFDIVSAHCSDTYRKTLSLGVPASHLRTLICGFEAPKVDLPPDVRAHMRRQMGVGDDEFLLVNVARLYPEKAQDSLLRIFKRLLERCPQCRLWIAGIGPLEAQLKAYCAELGLESKVDFVGFVEDLPNFLALVDLHVNSSMAEGVPLAICSGMAAGLPIVATAVGGLPDVILQGKTGILVEAGNETAFVDAVERLVRDSEDRRRLGSAARRFIETEYSLDHAVRQIENTYLELVANCASESL